MNSSSVAIEVTSQELQNLFGTVMAGTWTNTGLLATAAYFTYMRLFENSGRESYWTQLGLIAIMVVDAVSSGAGYAYVWDCTVTRWGMADAINPKFARPLPAHISTIATSLDAVAFHVFQTIHGQRIIGDRYPKLRYVLFLLWPFSLVPLITNVYAWIKNEITPGGSRIGWTLGFELSAATDGLFLVFMLCVLLSNRRHHLVSPDSVSAQWSATSWAIVMGLPSTVLSIVMVVVRSSLVQNNIEIALALNLGRIHTLSMLFVLYRDSGELDLEAHTKQAPLVLGGVAMDGIVVDVKTQHRVEINREAPLAAVKLGGLSENMAPYVERERGNGSMGAARRSFEEDFETEMKNSDEMRPASP